jgi:hypothetical protein
MCKKKSNQINGLSRLIAKYREEFRTPENIEYYSNKDFIKAEKRYVVYRLNCG